MRCRHSLTEVRLALLFYSLEILPPLKGRLLHHHRQWPCVFCENYVTKRLCSLLGTRGFTCDRKIAVTIWNQRDRALEQGIQIKGQASKQSSSRTRNRKIRAGLEGNTPQIILFSLLRCIADIYFLILMWYTDSQCFTKSMNTCHRGSWEGKQKGGRLKGRNESM